MVSTSNLIEKVEKQKKQINFLKKVKITLAVLAAVYSINLPEKLGKLIPLQGDVMDRIGSLINVLKTKPDELGTFLKINGAEFYAGMSGMNLTAELLRQMMYGTDSTLDISDLYKNTVVNAIKADPVRFSLTTDELSKMSDQEIVFYYLSKIEIPRVSEAESNINVDIVGDQVVITVQATSAKIEDLRDSLNYYAVVISGKFTEVSDSNGRKGYDITDPKISIRDTYNWTATNGDISARQSVFDLIYTLFGSDFANSLDPNLKHTLLEANVDLKDVDVNQLVQSGIARIYNIDGTFYFEGKDTVIYGPVNN